MKCQARVRIYFILFLIFCFAILAFRSTIIFRVFFFSLFIKILLPRIWWAVMFRPYLIFILFHCPVPPLSVPIIPPCCTASLTGRRHHTEKKNRLDRTSTHSVPGRAAGIIYNFVAYHLHIKNIALSDINWNQNCIYHISLSRCDS